MRYFGIFALITTAVAAPLTPKPLDRACPQYQSIWHDVRENSSSFVDLPMHVDVVRDVCCSDAMRKFPGEIDPLCPINVVQKRGPPYIKDFQDFCTQTAHTFGCMPGFDNDPSVCHDALRKCCRILGLDPNFGYLPDPICIPYILIDKFEQFNVPAHPAPDMYEPSSKRQTEDYNHTAAPMKTTLVKRDKLPDMYKPFVKRQTEDYNRTTTPTTTTLVKRDNSHMCSVPYFSELSCCRYDVDDPTNQDCIKVEVETLPQTPNDFETLCGFPSPACCPLWGGNICLPISYGHKTSDIQ
ncbi:hypothetical protein PTNB29_01591 [Pyrenophora teres f. teres]|nr:hypothetical protein PTNB29_01591 [Pyrenophora teres f. teres]